MTFFQVPLVQKALWFLIGGFGIALLRGLPEYLPLFLMRVMLWGVISVFVLRPIAIRIWNSRRVISTCGT